MALNGPCPPLSSPHRTPVSAIPRFKDDGDPASLQLCG